MSLNAGFGFEASRPAALTDWAARYLTAGPSLDLPLFDAGQRLATVKIQDVRARAAAVAYAQTVLGALDEAEDAVGAYNRQQTRQRSLQRAVDAWTAYLSIDARIRALSDAGKAQEATALCVGTGEGQSNWAFARFGQALDRAVAINKDAFDEAIAASESLSGKHVVIGLALAWLVACAGTWLAAARRLRAYEF